MIPSQGFWSYVHSDDDVEGGRIQRLARDIVNQYRLLTGEVIQVLFLDKDNLKWGDQWRKEIESTLGSVAFFIPVITPSYFLSPECRRELQLFIRTATDLGIKELLLPLHYVNVPSLTDDDTEDELIKLLQEFQWEDWRDLRFSDVESEEYRRAVSKLAERLVEANKHVEETNVSIQPLLENAIQDNVDETPGVLDILADSEETLSQLPDTLKLMTQDIEVMGQIMQESTKSIQRSDSQGRGFAGRQMISHQLALKLREPTDHLYSQSNIYATELHNIDSGIRIIIDKAAIEVRENPETLTNYCEYFDSVRNMSTATVQGINSFQQMFVAAEPLEKLSRDLRPVIRRLREGLAILIESSSVAQEWVRLIDAVDLTCEDSNPGSSE